MLKKLKQRKKQLEEMLKTVEARLEEPVYGRLEVIRRKNKTEFYKCTGPDQYSVRTRNYLRHSDLDEARHLAQAAYDKKALKIITGQIEAYDAFLKRWDEDRLKTLYGRMGIPYLYEYPFVIEDRMVRPDFYMLNVRTRKAFIMELLGMMDDPDYAKNNVRKLNSYARDGFIPGKNLILLYETQNQPVDMTVFRILMDTYLK